MELIFDNALQKAGTLLLKHAFRICKKKADTIPAWYFPHFFNYGRYKKAGYLDLPVKLSPPHLFRD